MSLFEKSSADMGELFEKSFPHTPSKTFEHGFVRVSRVIFCAKCICDALCLSPNKKRRLTYEYAPSFLFVDYAVPCTAENYANVYVVTQACRAVACCRRFKEKFTFNKKREHQGTPLPRYYKHRKGWACSSRSQVKVTFIKKQRARVSSLSGAKDLARRKCCICKRTGDS